MVKEREIDVELVAGMKTYNPLLATALASEEPATTIHINLISFNKRGRKESNEEEAMKAIKFI